MLSGLEEIVRDSVQGERLYEDRVVEVFIEDLNCVLKVG